MNIFSLSAPERLKREGTRSPLSIAEMQAKESCQINSTKRERWLKLDGFERAVILVGALILIYQIVIPPIVGVFDNGDFFHVMFPAGFRHVSENPEDMNVFVNSKFLFEKPGLLKTHYISSETLVARVARVVGQIISKDGYFDIRVLGLMHGALLLLGLALIISAHNKLRKPSRWILALLLVWIFTDVGYVAFFNSFYSQTASPLFLILTAGFFTLLVSNEDKKWTYFAGFIIAALLFICSKPQEAPQGVLLALLVFLAAGALRTRWAKTLGITSVAVVLGFATICYVAGPTGVKNNSLYNAVFEDLLKNSPNPAADLAELKLSNDLLKYVGTHAFIKDSPVPQDWFKAAFYQKMKHEDLLVFYLKHPSRLWALITRRSSKAFTLVTHYGNFEKRAGFPPGTKSSAFKIWSDFKQKVLPGSPWTLMVLFFGNIAAVAFLLIRRQKSNSSHLGLSAFGILNLMAIGAFLIPTLGDGTLDIVRQFYTFNAMTDLCLIGDVVFLIEAVTHKIQKSIPYSAYAKAVGDVRGNGEVHRVESNLPSESAQNLVSHEQLMRVTSKFKISNYVNEFHMKSLVNKCRGMTPFSSKSLCNDLAILAILIAFAYSCVRAYSLSITTDEAVTYLVHASGTYRDILAFNLPVTSNNHLLNSILIKIFTNLFGISELVIRMPALIGHTLYLFGIWKILNLFLKGPMLVLGVCLLTFHPFFIDLFSLARGYSLALGFLVLGLYYFFKRIKHFNSREVPQDNYIAWIMLAFSVLSHLSFLDAFLSLIAVYGLSEFILFLKRRWSTGINSKNWNYRSTLFPPLISSALLAIIYTIPILKMIRAGNQFTGGSRGFWQDTVPSLIDITLYGNVKNVQSVNIIFVICEIFIVGLIITAWGWLIYTALRKRGLMTSLTQYLFWVLLFLVVCPLNISLQHRLVGRPFPLDRYGIYFILIFGISILVFWENIRKTELKLLRSFLNTFFYIIILIVVAHFITCWNVGYFYSWKFDACTKQMMHYLVEANRGKQLMDNSVRLGVNWFIEASVNFYKEKNALKWLARVDPDPDGEFDYYYVTARDFRLKDKYELKLIKRFNLSDTYLLAWGSAAKQECFESVPSGRWKGEYYPNKTLGSPPVRVRDDGDGFINFDWGGKSPNAICGIGPDDFSVRWTRTIYFKSGTYGFNVTSDDGFKLFVDGQLKLDKWFDQPPTTYTVDVPLSAGNHTIKMEYYQASGQAIASLLWKVK